MPRVTLRSMARSSSFAGLSAFWQIATRIFLTPLVLAQVGLEGYGIWALLFSLSGPVTVVGVSFAQAYAKFTAEYDARRDYRGLNAILGSGVALIGAVALVVLSAIALARLPILRALGVEDAMLASAAQAMLLVVFTVFVQMSFGCVYQVLAGLQRVDLQHKAQMLSSAIYFGAAMWLLHEGWGLVGLGLAYLIGELSGIGLGRIWCRRLSPQLSLAPWHVTRDGLRSVVALGGRFQGLFLLSQVTNQGFKMAMSALMGPTALGVYELAIRLLRLADTGVGAVLGPMMPAFAHLHSGGEAERARAIYRHGSRLIFAIGFVSFGFLCLFTEEALFVWTGRPFPLAAWTFQVLAISALAKHLTGMGTASLRGRGSVRLELRTGLLTLFLRVLATGALYGAFGYPGFVIGEAIALVVGSGVFVAVFSSTESIDLGRFLREVVGRPVLVLTPLAVAVFAAATVWPMLPETLGGRWAALVRISAWGSVYGLALGAAGWFWVLSADERESVQVRVRRVLGQSEQASSA